jgi:hypothetical protein
VHIKFLEHGKGAAAYASAYVLDQFDHQGNVRAGVHVLRGDATTFNAVCHASPHVWKYTSGVIAWSKVDDPTDEQILEVLNDFEKHAFAGLDQSQYHLFAVLHTDDDGSKHIHVLTPRLDIQSGKSLNIAPPGHEKHFDALRDYFNTKYQWSRPDDITWTQTTQEPNHVAKLNAQAKKMASEELKTLTKKQFCKTVDNHVKTLLKTQTAKNRADIVKCIEQLQDVKSVKQSKEFLSVVLSNGNTHRLKGDFYHEQFEIGLYLQCVGAAAKSRATADELAAALRDADQLRETYRAKRATYHQRHYAFAQSTGEDNSTGVAPQLNFDRDRESIPPSNTTTDSELYGANRGTSGKTREYRYYGNLKSEIEHRFIFNINSGSTDQNQQPVAEHLDRSEEHPSPSPGPSTASDSQSKWANRERNTNADHGKTEYAKSKIHFMRDDLVGTADLFNSFLFGLSSPYKLEDNRSATTNYSTELRSNHGPNQLFEHPTEISYADRDRPIFDRAKRLVESTKQLVSRTKRSLESTGQFIKEYFDHLQRSRAEFNGQNQQLELRERSSTSLDFGYESRTFKARAGRIFGAITASISRKLENPIANAIDDSIKSTGFKQHCQRPGEDRITANSTDNRHTADRPGDSTLNHLAIAATNRLLHRLGDAKQADQYAWGNCRTINDLNQQLEQLEPLVAKLRPKPKPATDFRDLRIDAYYPGYVADHKQLSVQQQQAYNDNNLLQLVDCVQKKAQNLDKYISQASRMINTWDYDKIEEIIKNDQRMLNYLKCEIILEPQNDHLKHQRASYQSCLESFENIKSHIHEVKKPKPTPQSYVLEQTYEPENQPNRDYDLDF